MSNNDQVIIPLDVIDEDELEEFIGRIKTLTHAEVKIKRQFILTSDSPSVLDGLAFLFGDLLSKPEYQNHNRKPLKNGRTPKIKIKKLVGGG